MDPIEEMREMQEEGGNAKPEIKHDEKKKKFYMLINGKEAKAEYKFLDDRTIDFHHTYTPPELRKQGIAKSLYDTALSWMKEKKLKAKPTCEYAQNYFKKYGGDML